MHRSGGGGRPAAGRRRGRWSQSEINRLRELYGRRSEAAIARDLARSVRSVRRMIGQLFDGPPKSGPWSAKEVEALKTYLGCSQVDVIARALGRPVEEVEEQIGNLGRIRQNGRWTREEIGELKRIYGTRTDEDLSRVLGRSVESIQRQARRLALAKDKAFLRRLNGKPTTRMPRWSDADLDRLRELYPVQGNLEIAIELDRTVKSIVSKAHHLGLRKDPERLRAMGRENVRLRYRS